MTDYLALTGTTEEDWAIIGLTVDDLRDFFAPRFTYVPCEKPIKKYSSDPVHRFWQITAEVFCEDKED